MLEPINSVNRRNRERYYIHVLSRLFYSDQKRKDVQSVIKDAFGLYLVSDPLGENFEVRMCSDGPPSATVERSLAEDAVVFLRIALFHESNEATASAPFCGSVAAVAASDAKVILNR